MVKKTSLKENLKFVLFCILSFPKSVYFNFKVFPLKIAFKLPVLVGYNYKIKRIHRNCIEIEKSPINSLMIRFGYNGSPGPIPQKGVLDICGKIIFKSFANFAKGCSLRINGILYVGSYFTSNLNCTFICKNQINIKDDVMFGWNITLLDSNGHHISSDSVQMPDKNTINIGMHTWVCSEVHILPGSYIGDDCVVGYKSLVNKAYCGNNLLIAGSPASVRKTDINWTY